MTPGTDETKHAAVSLPMALVQEIIAAADVENVAPHDFAVNALRDYLDRRAVRLLQGEDL